MAVYILRFERAAGTYGRNAARYYIGYAEDQNVPVRIGEHRKGTSGAKLPEWFHSQGIGFKTIRIFWGKDRTFERTLKNGGHYYQHDPVIKGRKEMTVRTKRTLTPSQENALMQIIKHVSLPVGYVTGEIYPQTATALNTRGISRIEIKTLYKKGVEPCLDRQWISFLIQDGQAFVRSNVARLHHYDDTAGQYKRTFHLEHMVWQDKGFILHRSDPLHYYSISEERAALVERLDRVEIISEGFFDFLKGFYGVRTIPDTP